MKAPPLFCREGPENWMVQQPDSASEPLLRIGKRRIHRHQRIVELAQRLQAGAVFRSRMLGGRTPRGQQPEPGDVKGAYTISQFGSASERFADPHRIQRALGSCCVTEPQMFQDLRAAPLACRSMTPVGLRHSTGDTLRLAADLFQLWRHTPPHRTRASLKTRPTSRCSMNQNRRFYSGGVEMLQHFCSKLQIYGGELHFPMTDASHVAAPNRRGSIFLFRLGLAARLQVNIHVDLIHQ